MRQAIVARELDAFRIDHNHADLLGRRPHEHRDDDRVQKDRLARAGRTSNKQVRKLCDIDRDRLSFRIPAESDLERAPALCIRQDIAQTHALPLMVRNLDADKRSTGNRREDADRGSGKRERDIIFEVRDAAHALALAHRDLERRDDRARDPARDLGREAELLKRALELLCRGPELFLRTHGLSRIGIRFKKGKRRKLSGLGRGSCRGLGGS